MYILHSLSLWLPPSPNFLITLVSFSSVTLHHFSLSVFVPQSLFFCPPHLYLPPIFIYAPTTHLSNSFISLPISIISLYLPSIFLLYLYVCVWTLISPALPALVFICVTISLPLCLFHPLSSLSVPLYISLFLCLSLTVDFFLSLLSFSISISVYFSLSF